jgi:signal transduction histidine kinase
MWLTVAVVALLWIAYSAWDSQHGETTIMDRAVAEEASLVIRTLPTEILKLNVIENFKVKPPETQTQAEAQTETQGSQKLISALHIQVWSADNRLLVLTPNTPPERFAPASLSGFATLNYQGERWRVYGLWDATNSVHVQMGFRQTWGGIAVLYAVKAGVKMLAISILLAPLLAFVVTWSLKPLQQMKAEVLQRKADDLSDLKIEKSATELEPLTTAFNTLLHRLRFLRDAEQQFFSDAAHELRTPLAALRLQAQVAAREPDAALRQIALNKMLGGIDRTTRVVEQLLELAKADHRANQPASAIMNEAFSVESCVLDALLALEVEIQERKIQIATDIAKRSLHGDKPQICAAIRNLVENAIHYSPVGSVVQISAEQQDGEALIEIAVIDQGPGIAAAERENVVKRFHRLQAAQSVATGSGLGLSIVERICKNHGGQLVLSAASVSGGLKATLSLPAAPLL